MSEEPTTNQITWQIHESHPELVEPLRAGLALVIDPEIGMNVIQLGLIRDASFVDDVVRLKMILTTPFCPYGPAMIESTRLKAQEAINKPVTIEMGPEMWDFSMMEDPSALDWGLY